MNALRLIFDDPPASIVMPEEFRHGSVEVIIMPLAPSPTTASPKTEPSWLSAFSGKWQGAPLAREPQGEYEIRDVLK